MIYIEKMKVGESYTYYGTRNASRVSFVGTQTNAWSGRRYYLFKECHGGHEHLLTEHDVEFYIS